jgi:hypothetical protein
MTTDKTNSSSYLFEYVRWTSPSSPRRHRCGSSLFGCCRPPQPHKPHKPPAREAPPTRTTAAAAAAASLPPPPMAMMEMIIATDKGESIGRSAASTALVGYTAAGTGDSFCRRTDSVVLKGRVRHGAAVVLAVGGRGKRQAECTYAYVVDDDIIPTRGQRARPHHVTFPFDHLDCV